VVNVELFNISGEIETHDLADFPEPPTESLALHFADKVSHGGWITDIDEFWLLHFDGIALLAYTRAGLEALWVDCG
jgi:hypothetical protein